MANHNLHTFIQNTSTAVVINPNSANKQVVDRATVINYISEATARQATNNAIVVNPSAHDSNVIVVVFTYSEDDKKIGSVANTALFEIREEMRLKEIKELEERLALLRAKG